MTPYFETFFNLKKARLEKSFANENEPSYHTLNKKIYSLMDVNNEIQKGGGDNTAVKISHLSEQIKNDFLRVKKDFDEGSISETQYNAYLRIFKELIDSDLKYEDNELLTPELLSALAKYHDELKNDADNPVSPGNINRNMIVKVESLDKKLLD